MAMRHGDIELIEKSLTDYKLKAQEMNVGVNFMALDDERKRQEHLLRKLRDIEEEISSPRLASTKLPHLASVVGTELNHNTKCLQYLTGISELERCIGEVSAHFAERSVELSDPNSLHKDIVTYKTLTDNVKSCWSYVDQLVTLAHIHLKTSAEYHQFYHEANEIDAKLNKQLAICQKSYNSATTRRSQKEATKVANEIREQLEIMRSLWKRSMALVKRSETIVPMKLRLGGVSKGCAVGDPSNHPVMVRAMVSLTGPDYKIQQGEHLRLMDNRQDSYLWHVQTSSGVAEVPSICFWLTDSDRDATERSISIKQQCKTVWLEIIRLTRLRLYAIYTDLLQQFVSQEVHCTHEESLNAFLRDLQKYIVPNCDEDGHMKTSIEKFQRQVVVSKRLERLQSGDINLKESDLVRIRAPLLRLQDHLAAFELMQEDIKLLNDHIAEYLSEVDSERRRIAGKLDHLSRISKRSENQLNDMVKSINQWKATSPDTGIYVKSKGRLKIEPLFESDQSQRRSRSHPAVPLVAESTASSDTEILVVQRHRERRAKSQTLLLDAMVQIGKKSRTAETQYMEDTLRSSDRRYDRKPPRGVQRNKSIQQGPVSPPQRTVMTQIGRSSMDGSVQVDSATLASYKTEIANAASVRRSASVGSNSSDEAHEYVPEGVIQPIRAAKVKSANKFNTTTQIGTTVRKRSASMVNLVHSATQLGTVKHDRALSPVFAAGCPHCRGQDLWSSQTQVGPLYSGSERYLYQMPGQINSENGPSQYRLNKKIQCGYPCLTERVNLYAQCDVLGPRKGDAKTSTDHSQVKGLYQTTSKKEQMNSYAQVGALYANSQQQVGPSTTDLLTSSTQVGTINRDRMSSPITPKRAQSHVVRRRNIRSQVGSGSLQDLHSSSTMIERVPLDKESFITSVSMRPRAASTTTQVGAILAGSSVQTSGYTSYDQVSKRIQTGYSQLSGRSDSYAQVGQIYRQAEVQMAYQDINVEPSIAPSEFSAPMLEQAPPDNRNEAVGMSVQVTRHMHDDMTQVSQVLSHDEVQTYGYSDYDPHYARVQRMTSSKKKSRRSASVPSIYQSSETQIGPMVMHESLSPITLETDFETIRSTTVREVAASPNKTRNKRVQSLCMPNIRDAEMQIGQLLQEGGTQTLKGFETGDEQIISTTFQEQQQRATSLPDIGLAEEQVRPKSYGKKLQVAIAMSEKMRNKKLQVAIASPREMYGVQIETQRLERKESFDVGCDTKILPINASKKVQCNLFDGDMTPEIPVKIENPAVYAAPPMRSMMESASSEFSPETRGKKMQVAVPALFAATGPPLTVDTACDATEGLKFFDAHSQYDSAKPAMFGKKLQVEMAYNPVPKEMVDTASDPIEPIRTHGKKMQVDLAIPSQAVHMAPPKSLVDHGCEAVGSVDVFDAAQQTAVLMEAPEPIYVEKQPEVFAAPPSPMSSRSSPCDVACDPVARGEACDSFTQSEKIHTQGKKLQVCISVEEQSMYEIAASQALYEERYITPPSPAAALPVFAAPPQQMHTTEKGCEAMPMSSSFDVSCQSGELPMPKPVVVGKKLQVSPATLATSVAQTIYKEPTQVPVMPATDIMNVFSAPPQPSKPMTADTGCDALTITDTYDAGVQFASDVKPVVVGKKLQVAPAQMKVSGVQSTTMAPQPEVIQLVEAPKAFAAPESRTMFTEGCDAQAMAETFDAGCQSAEIYTEKPVIHGKKLQVASTPITEESTQTTTATVVGKKLQVSPSPYVVSGTQAYSEVTAPTKPVVVGKKLQVNPETLQICSVQAMGEVLAPVTTIHVEQAPKVFAAAPVAKALTEDRGCEALRFSDVFDVSTQAGEVPKVKPIVVGKKLQVSPPTQVSATAQTDPYEPSQVKPATFGKKLQVSPNMMEVTGVQSTTEMPQQVIQVEEVHKVFAAPPTKPEITTLDRGCEAVASKDVFNAGVQTAQMTVPQPAVPVTVASTTYAVNSVQTLLFEPTHAKPVVLGKKLQVSPAAFAFETAQTFNVATFGKKMQVQPEAMQVGAAQTMYETPTPAPVVKVEEAPKVFAAPPVEPKSFTEDKGCEALAQAESFDAGVQFGQLPAEKPLVVGKKLQVSPPANTITSTQTDILRKEQSKVSAVGKKLQVSPPMMTTSDVQSTLEIVAPQASIVHVHEAPKEFAAPPKAGFNASCQTAEVVAPVVVGKKLQVAPISSTSMSTQTETMKPIVLGKKLQVSPPAQATIETQTAAKEPMDTKGIQTIFEPATPAVAPIIKIEEAPKVFSAPPMQPKVQQEDRGCDALALAMSFDASVQSAETPVTKPSVLGKKLQVTPTALAFANAQTRGEVPAPVPEKRVVLGKKLQVAPDPYETSSVQAYGIPSQAAKTAVVGKKLQVGPPEMMTSGVQSTIAAPQPVIHVQEVTKTFSAPPPEPKVATTDRGCDALSVVASFNAGTQSSYVAEPEKTIIVGKKLQVSPAALACASVQALGLAPVKPTVLGKKLQVSPPAMETTGTQATEEAERPVVQVQEVTKVFSAPPVEPKASTEDHGCDALSAVAVYDAGVQWAQTVEVPKPVVLGKKLQVSPTALVYGSAQMHVPSQAPQKPIVLGKKLQVSPPAMETTGTQATEELEKPMVQVHEVTKVFSAPPAEPKAATEDRGCDALSVSASFDAGVQWAQTVEAPKPVVLGKKLQVSPTALAYASAQICVEPKAPPKPVVLGKKLQVSPPAMETTGTQATEEAEKPVIQVHEVTKVFSAPPVEPKAPATDRGCDALLAAPSYDAEVQFAHLEPATFSPQPSLICGAAQTASEVPPPKRVIHGKKLQVSLAENLTTETSQTSSQPKPALTVSGVQTIQEATQSIIKVQEVHKTFSAPPVAPQKAQTEDSGCDAVSLTTSYDASVQSERALAPIKPVMLGKKMQVNPIGLAIEVVQTKVEPAPTKAPAKPVTFGKKLQVYPEALEVSATQTIMEATRQPAVQVVEVAKEFSAPPLPQKAPTEDRGCDALSMTPAYDAGVQWAEAKPATLGKEAQIEPAPILSKEIQAIGEVIPAKFIPPALETTAAQSTIAATPPVVQVQQVAPVFAAPPKANTEDRGFDALALSSSCDAAVQSEKVKEHKPTTYGKKLQVTPLAQVSTEVQAVGEAPKKKVYEKNLQTLPAILETTGIQSALQQVAVQPIVKVEEAPKVFAAPITTEDRGCDALASKSAFDAEVQSVEFVPEKTAVTVESVQAMGVATAPQKKVDISEKQLQVTPLSLETSAIQTAKRAMGSHVIQAASTPEMLGKKLQTPPQILESSVAQTSHESASKGAQTEVVPEQPEIRVEHIQQEFTAPPVVKIETTDHGCDALSIAKSYDVSTQSARLETFGKKLQASPSCVEASCTAEFSTPEPKKTKKVTTYGKKLQVDLAPKMETSTMQSTSRPTLEVSSIQTDVTRESIIQPPVKLEPVFSAPPKSITVDHATDAKPMIQIATTGVQSDTSATQLTTCACQSVSRPRLVVSSCQSIYAEKPTQVIVQESTHLVESAPPVQPPIQTTDASCDPVPRKPTNDTFTQSAKPSLETSDIQSTLEAPVRKVRTENDSCDPSEWPVQSTAVQSTRLTTEAKGLQVMPAAITTSMVQTVAREVDPVVKVETTKFVESAPPVSAVSSMQDTTCDPIPAPRSEDSFTQPHKIETHPKNLQTLSNPLVESAIQATEPKPVVHVKDSQVTPDALLVARTQSVYIEERVAAPVVPVVPPKPHMSNVGCDPMPKPYTFGKKMQVLPLPLAVSSSQTAFVEKAPEPEIVQKKEEAAPVFAAPPTTLIATSEKSCEPLPTIQVFEAGVQAAQRVPCQSLSTQHDTAPVKPPCRSVRIQKGVGAFEGTRSVGFQHSQPEPRRSPRSPTSPRTLRTVGIEWGVQNTPMSMVGMTQTPKMEVELQPKPESCNKVCQADLGQPIRQIPVLPTPPKAPENLLMFTRETTAKLTKRGGRARSQGLIPYKTQVFNQPGSLSVSVPNMLQAQSDIASPATVTEGLPYQHRSSGMPRRYVSRFRSPSVKSAYTRRNRSIDGDFQRSASLLPRHYISEGDLSARFTHMEQQQMELEKRCDECITQCVRLIGYEKVATMLQETRMDEELSGYEDLESYYAKRRRLQNARTQYTSTTALGCPYCYHAYGMQAGDGQMGYEGATITMMERNEGAVYSGDEGYEWDAGNSPYGTSKHSSYRWISRTPISRAMQTEPTPEEVDDLMKSRALSAYCSDYELQQSGIKANYEENGAFTFVAWKANHEGEDKLELDTVGRLLRLTMVGARVPGTGEVISAADAFYRGILRVIYMDDERGVIMPLPTAINANAVIVEKRYSTGIGIALLSSPRKYPVECTALWHTPNMRRRTYRVNYIQASETDRVTVAGALDEGIIDKYSGELVGVQAPPTADMGDPLLEMRESSVGTGETFARRTRPERFNIHEAILNDIISVELIQPEVIVEHSTSRTPATSASRRTERSGSTSSDSRSDMEV